MATDEANFVPFKIILIPTQTTKEVLSPFSTPLISWERTTEGRAEKVQAEIRLDQPPPGQPPASVAPQQPSPPPTDVRPPPLQRAKTGLDGLVARLDRGPPDRRASI